MQIRDLIEILKDEDPASQILVYHDDTGVYAPVREVTNIGEFAVPNVDISYNPGHGYEMVPHFSDQYGVHADDLVLIADARHEFHDLTEAESPINTARTKPRKELVT